MTLTDEQRHEIALALRLQAITIRRHTAGRSEDMDAARKLDELADTLLTARAVTVEG